MFAAFTLVMSLLLAATSADVVAVTLPARSDVTLPLAPAGRVELKRDPTVTLVRIELDRVPAPSTLGPAFNTYVAWVVSPEGNFENIGELAMDKDKARLEATTRFEQLGLLITAEPHYMVDRPSAAVAFRSQAPRSSDVRHVTVSVQIGTTDYSAIQNPAQSGVPTLVMESRAAFQIAKAAGAERLAEAEFRQAKVAIDTMEQMLSRSGPFEIVAQSANETVRRSQESVAVARERQSSIALEALREEVAVLKQEKQNLDLRIQQLTGRQESANTQIQKLQADLATANRERQQLAQGRDQAAAHETSLTTELSDVKKSLQDLQAHLVLPLRNEFFDLKAGVLTPIGRDALAHLCGVAEAVPGQVRLEGSVSDAVFEAARQYLIQAGVAQDRIVLKRFPGDAQVYPSMTTPSVRP